MVPGHASAALAMALAVAMIVTSVLAFLGLPKARSPALVAALVFFGLLVLQSLLTALDPTSLFGELPPARITQKLWAGVVRNSIEIGLNCWVYLSAKTKRYFESKSRPRREENVQEKTVTFYPRVRLCRFSPINGHARCKKYPSYCPYDHALAAGWNFKAADGLQPCDSRSLEFGRRSF